MCSWRTDWPAAARKVKDTAGMIAQNFDLDPVSRKLGWHRGNKSGSRPRVHGTAKTRAAAQAVGEKGHALTSKPARTGTCHRACLSSVDNLEPPPKKRRRKITVTQLRQCRQFDKNDDKPQIN
jgi:hypothetical protein